VPSGARESQWGLKPIHAVNSSWRSSPPRDGQTVLGASLSSALSPLAAPLTFTLCGTHLSKGGVSLRTAQAAMRHSKPDLTANVYTDPKLLDVAGAMNALPSLPLDQRPQVDRQQATGTADAMPLICQEDARTLVLTFVPNPDNGRAPLSLADKTAARMPVLALAGEGSESLYFPGQNPPQTAVDEAGQNGRYRARTCDPQRVMLVL
jgi:hypothetical protein